LDINKIYVFLSKINNKMEKQIKDYLASLKWDGVGRIGSMFHDYLGAMPSYYNRYVAVTLLIDAIDRVFNPGCSMKDVVILHGPQDCGKSTFVQKLSKGWYSNQLNIKNNVQNLEILQNSWIVELADIDVTKMQHVKDFVFKKQDTYKDSNDDLIYYYDRIFIPIITTNMDDWNASLSHRYSYVKCGIESYKISELTEDIVDQIWAEAVETHRQFYA
jgi:predicted P-loop ATPase